MTSAYETFLEAKRITVQPSGFSIDRDVLNVKLFDWQKDIVRWALRCGKAAIWADCGLGKSAMQLEWAHRVHLHTGGNVLILAPLAVAKQTQREGVKFGIEVTVCETQADVQNGINITNYEKMHHFDLASFSGVVLDESSILKAYDGKTRTSIIDAFRFTPYKLACTATPSPNDYMELGNHAEFLGAMSRTEMLSMFFVHDGGDTSKWRLKGHAANEFWKWIASWAVMLRKPSDLGYSDEGFVLPKVHVHHHTVKTDVVMEGYLFAIEARTLEERRKARKASMSDRVAKCADIVSQNSDPWLVWCDLNAEGDALEDVIPSSVQIAGSDTNEFKEQTMLSFADGNVPILISKPSICGYGMNFQVCPNMAFVGLSDSYEMYYQAKKRIDRYGQTKEVHIHIITSELESSVLKNIQRKEKDAQRMADEMVQHMQVHNTEAVHGTTRKVDAYNPRKQMIIPNWL